MFETQYALAQKALSDLDATAEQQVADLITRNINLSNRLNDVTASIDSPLVTLPAIRRDVQALSGWIQPANAGDSGGSDPTKPSGTFLMTPGNPAVFSAKGAYAYNNGYWYYRFGAQNNATRFLYRFAVQFPTNADLAACQALEFELQQTIAGKVYNMAWQAPFKSTTKLWRTFDYAASRLKTPGVPYWAEAPVPLDPTVFSDGKWVSISAEYRRDGGTLTHVSLSINGQVFPVNVARAGFQDPAKGTGSAFNVAYQLDSLKTFPPYSTNVRGMEVHWL